MLHILRATRRSLAIALVVFGYATADVSAGQKVLDLRSVPSSGRLSLGVPGSSLSAILGQSAASTTRGYRLPFRIVFQSVTAQGGKKLTVELELLNITKSRIRVPSCLDESKAHGQGAADRRTLTFGLLFQTGKREVRELMDVTFDSASNSACSLSLDPAGTLLVIDEMQVPDEIVASNSTVTAKAFVEEWKLENERY